MWKRPTPGPASNALKTFGTFLVLFVCILVIGILVALFRMHPEFRSAAAWLPYDVAAETKVSGVVEVVQDFSVRGAAARVEFTWYSTRNAAVCTYTPAMQSSCGRNAQCSSAATGSKCWDRSCQWEEKKR